MAQGAFILHTSKCSSNELKQLWCESNGIICKIDGKLSVDLIMPY